MYSDTRRGSARGFSLVEMAIVLVVVGIIVNFGLKGASAVGEGNARRVTQTRLDNVQRALVLYVIRNGCLPCPADPNPSVAANAGRAIDATNPYSTACGFTAGTGAVCTFAQGLVPWRSLEMAKEDVIDGYGAMIDYAPDPTMTTNATRMMRQSGTSPYTPIATLNVYDATATDITLQAAYVLISHGPDKSGAYLPNSGTRLTDPHASALQTCNIRTPALPTPTPACASTYYMQNDPRGAGAAAWFDDVVRFSTKQVIIQQCGSNACGNPA